MGKLYNRRDLLWNREYWNRKEQQLSALIANGLLDASFLDRVIVERREHEGPCERGCGCRTYRQRERFDLERKREQAKLLKTSELMRELLKQKALFKACPHCHVGVGKRGPRKGKPVDRPCTVHGDAYKAAKSKAYWAGERNVKERSDRRYELLGMRRAVEGWSEERYLVECSQVERELEAAGQRYERYEQELNEWETLYMQCVKEGTWPLDATTYDVSPDYKGWLWTMLFEDEMTEAQYLAELERLKMALEDNEVTAKTVAGTNATLTRAMRHDDGELPARRPDSTHLDLLERFYAGRM
jgi:hypothetical protein